MKIAFTICSNNYLSQAKTLGDSLLKHNPDYKFIIGLCDKKNELVDYSFYDSFEILELDTIQIPNLEWMIYNYNIIELNTASKPYFFRYIQNYYNKAEMIVYIDPDIKIYRDFEYLELELKDHTCILTPHITSSIPYDNQLPNENVFLNFGIYNLGFIAIRVCSEANKLIDWWSKKLAEQCIDNIHEGLFVDQLPMNFAPIFFKNVKVSLNLGFNFAYWNMHERKISFRENEYWINTDIPLIFMHFSNFKPTYPLNIAKYQTRNFLEKDTTLYTIFDDYLKDLTDNKYFSLLEVPCYYVQLRKEKENRELKIRQEKEYILALALHKENSKLTNRLRRRLRKIYNAFFE